MVPGDAQRRIDAYHAALAAPAPGQVAGLYVVGSVALGDFSARQSNLDLVVVTEPALDGEQLRQVARAHRHLRRAGRPGCVCYATWRDIADGPDRESVVAFAGTRRTSGDDLVSPMTWAILRSDPVAVTGPDWPVVWQDPAALQAWFAERLRRAVRPPGPLLLRRAIGPYVLEAARLAMGVLAGRVLSKSEAGEAAMSAVRSHYRRILTDAVGYRRGAQTSMYWGPFERRTDGLNVVTELAAAAGVP